MKIADVSFLAYVDKISFSASTFEKITTCIKLFEKLQETFGFMLNKNKCTFLCTFDVDSLFTCRTLPEES